MEKEALAFIRSLQQIYLEQRDMERIIDSIDENTSWIGTGRHEICKCFTDSTQALFSEKSEYSDGFTIADSWYESVPISDNACIIYGEVHACPNDRKQDFSELHNRVSAVCVNTDSGMKLLHLHMSSPDSDLEPGKYFVKNTARGSQQALRDMVAQQGRQLEILTGNVPGGVHQCQNDPLLTLVSMSGGFLSMFGYSRQEIKELFNDSFINMIYPPDRANVRVLTAEQLSHGDTVEYEYRITCKNGSLMWVLDRGKLVDMEDGSQSFFCIMLDITERKAESEKLRLSLERHKIIMDQATNIIFEWDMTDDTIDFSSNWEKKFGYAPIFENISKSIPLSNNIHPDDMQAFMKIMNDTAMGVPYSETEFRIRSISTEYTWCRIRATTQFDSDHRPIKAVGVIVDIDEEKNRNKLLIDAAQRDPLTKLYNKDATRNKIENILAQKDDGAMHAIMIIDVDNFKSINDRFGHHCGDAVLANMSRELKRVFRCSDIIGRIGGDEFLVFLNNIGQPDVAARRAQEVVNIFCEMPPEFGSDLSCSVGVALYPRDAVDYLGLSHCADSALYRVKNNGKVNYAFFDRNMQDVPSYVGMRTDINESSQDAAAINGELLRYAFSTLYSSPHVSDSINNLLSAIGRAYDVSRVYIFEASEDGLYCSNTFEWCNEGISPEMDTLQNISFEHDIAGFFDNFDEDGVFYCQDIQTLNPILCSILERQGVVSVLQCFIKDDTHFKGYIGFDECTESRYWTKDQVHTLTLIANVLSTFLMKQRLKEQLDALKGP